MSEAINSKRIHELIANRRSIRAFSDKGIDDESLVQLFEAARWASSSRNEQPWRFISARKEEAENFQRTLSCLNESNRIWAQHSALLIVVLAKKNFTTHPVPNSHAQHDVGLSIGNLALQATALGIFLHQLGGINYEKVREVFEVPEEYEVISIIVGGYPGSHDSLPEKLRERESLPRQRKPLGELVFEGRFGIENSVFKSNRQ
ncbi:nitroreductase family protein [soil metagenome]